MRRQEAEYVVPEDCYITMHIEGDTITIMAESITKKEARRVFEIRGWEEWEAITGERI